MQRLEELRRRAREGETREVQPVNGRSRIARTVEREGEALGDRLVRLLRQKLAEAEQASP